MGNRSTSPADVPTVLPGLQNRNIISVVLGDYHFGALTEDGTLLTWGKYSAGAIGLGDPFKNPVGSPGGFHPVDDQAFSPYTVLPWGVPQRGVRAPPRDVEEPTEVRFDYQDHKRDKFVFSVAASGWHTAALVIDLEPNNPPGPRVSESEDREESISHTNLLHTRGGGGDEEDEEMMPGAFPRVHLRGGPGPFRIGYAGRGLARGAALQSHVHQQPGTPDASVPQPQPHNTAPWTGRVLHGGFRGLPPRRGGPPE
jgi:SCF-associated factor 1